MWRSAWYFDAKAGFSGFNDSSTSCNVPWLSNWHSFYLWKHQRLLLLFWISVQYLEQDVTEQQMRRPARLLAKESSIEVSFYAASRITVNCLDQIQRETKQVVSILMTCKLLQYSVMKVLAMQSYSIGYQDDFVLVSVAVDSQTSVGKPT